MPESLAPAKETAPSFYLPDLCAARMVLGIVLTAELIALLLATARLSVPARFWDDLARTSFFLLWIALCSAALISCCCCPSRLTTTVLLTIVTRTVAVPALP